MKIIRSSSSRNCSSSAGSSRGRSADCESAATIWSVLSPRTRSRRTASIAALCATRNNQPVALSGVP
ncbi:MAG: hypothetical protein DMF86_05120 [Acidobacteria bacterium]|nr:MAG: hypothetical protein DMF86_05120 [Acidobacteriota bacterium]